MKLSTKLKNKSAHIGIIGLGYVGLPLVLRFGDKGFKVTGFDIDKTKVKKLNKGESYIKHIKSQKINRLVQKNLFQATSNYSQLSDVDCILICVPTPLNSKREPDLSYILKTTKEVAKHLRKGQIVVLESTTYPGTTREVLLPRFEKNGIKVGKDFYLAFSPEREDPGNGKYNTKNTPKVVGGITEKCTEIGELLYQQIVDEVVTVSSTEVAEFTKLFENIFRAVNIALVNELKMLSNRMGVDIWEIIKAASTKPFGFMPFYPGPGLGGHCIPIDPFYLTWKAREYDFATRFIELAGEINTNMPYYVIQKTIEALNEKGKSINGAKVLVLGLAYKKDVDDTRESPALKIIDLLRKKGANVDYNDPFIPEFPKTRKYNLNMSSTPLTAENLKKFDCSIIVTAHSVYDAKFLVENSNLVIDTRNLIKDGALYHDKVKKV